MKTINFQNPSYIGDPINAVKIYNDKEVDELVVLDIHASKNEAIIDFELIKDFAAECFMPLTYGGGVSTYADFKTIFNLGVEKIVVNTLIFDNPVIVERAIADFGSQSIVASIDLVRSNSGQYEVFSHSGRRISTDLMEHLKFVTNLGVGELLITSVDQEGTWEGFDTTLLELVNSNIEIPVIANGGCGTTDDLKKVLYDIDIQAAALGSMAVYQKQGMGVLIRFPQRNEIIIDE